MTFTLVAFGLMLADAEQVMTMLGICVLVAIICGFFVVVVAAGQFPAESMKKTRRDRSSKRALLKVCSWISVMLGVVFGFEVLQMALIGFINSDRNWYSVWKLFVIALAPFVAGQFGLYRARKLERSDKARRNW